MTRRTQAAALGIAFVLPLLLAVVVWTLDPFSLVREKRFRVDGAVTRPNGYVVIDAHSHLSPQAVERVLDVMDRNGIWRIVNLSGGYGDRHAATAEAFRAVTDRVFFAATIDWKPLFDPDFGEYNARLLEWAVKEYGAVALKVNKGLGLYYPKDSDLKEFLPVDTPRLDPLWRKAGELAVPVYIHTGDPKAFWEPVTPDNERYEELAVHPGWSFADPRYPKREELLRQFENLVRRHPETTFIGVHVGNDPEDIDNVARMLDAYPNLVIDIAARIPEIGRHPREKLRAFFIKHQDRILFGSDIGIGPERLTLGSSDGTEKTETEARLFYARHWRFLETYDRQIDHPTPIQGDWKIDAVGLPPEVLDKIYAKNAIRLMPGLGLTEARDDAAEGGGD